MRRILFVLLFLSFVSTAEAGYLELAWTGNTEPDLGGYRIYYGTEPGEYINFVNVGNVTSHTLDSMLDGVTYYIALTAYDTAGNESGFSGEVSGAPVPGEPNPATSAVVESSSSGGGCFLSTVLPDF